MDIIKAFENNDMQMHITIMGSREEPLFRASDIGAVLGISQINSSIRDYDGSEKVVQLLQTLGGPQEVTFLTEYGLYEILFRSQKPIAKTFKKWVCEIIKEMRLNAISEYQKQLVHYDKQLQDSQKQVEIVISQKEQNLIKNFSKKHMVYLGSVNNNIGKPGWTDDIETRLRDLKRDLGPNFTFVHVYESRHNIEIEKQLFKKQVMIDARFSKEYNGHNYTELFMLDSTFTLGHIDKLIIDIKNNIEASDNNKDRDGEINQLKLELVEKDKAINELKDQLNVKEILENEDKNNILYIGHDTAILNLFQLGSVVILNKNNRNFEYDFTHESPNAKNIELLAKQLLKSFYYENNYYKIECAQIINVLNFCIKAYDKFYIDKSPEQLSFFIATKYRPKITNSTKASFDMDIYKLYVEQNII
jgi:prophage antirepressor-like protein